MNEDRRRFLRVAGGAGVPLGTGGIVWGSSVASAASGVTTLRGRFVAAARPEGVDGSVTAISDGVVTTARLDAAGSFELTVPTNTRYELIYRRTIWGGGFDTVHNGVPHLFVTGRYTVGTVAVDVGRIRLPAASTLDCRVVDGDGAPLLGAVVRYRVHGFPTAPAAIQVDAAGFVRIPGATASGLEVVGAVTVEFTPPLNDSAIDREFQRSVTVREDTTLTATYADEAVTWETTGGSDTSTSEDELDAAIDSTAGPASDESPPARGFLTNGSGDQSMGVLDDPVLLTVGGFLLSVMGIAHQLLRGG